MGKKLPFLAGRKALITGAADRLGRATALALAAAGADIVIHYHRSRRKAEATAAEISRLGRKAWTVKADLADDAQARKLVAHAVKLARGPLDILVNSASIFPICRLADMTSEDLALNMQVNALSPLALARDFAAQDKPGDIINFLDCRIGDYDPAHVAYLLSKQALAGLTRMMALEFAPRIRVNAVAPGLILPPPGQSQEYLERLVSTNPLKRHGNPADITEAVLFLLRSPFVTGQVIYIDGGRHLRGPTVP